MVPVDADTFRVSKKMQTVLDALPVANTKLNTIRKLNEIIDALAIAGVLTDVDHENG